MNIFKRILYRIRFEFRQIPWLFRGIRNKIDSHFSRLTRFNKKYYVIYKGTGGLTHMMWGLAECIRYTQDRGYHLIIDCQTNVEFGAKFEDLFYLENILYSEDYATIDTKIMDILPTNFSTNAAWFVPREGKPKPYVPPDEVTHFVVNSDPEFIEKTRQFNKINGNRRIRCYAGNGVREFHASFLFLLKYLRVKDNIMQEVLEKRIEEPYLGVHFRNNEIKNNINTFLERLDNVLQNNKDINLIYIATDDKFSIKIFKDFLLQFNQQNKRSVRIQHQETIPYYNKLQICSIDEEVLQEKWGLNKKEYQIQSLQDLYLLYHASIFIDSHNSGFSLFVLVMKKHGICFIR